MANVRGSIDGGIEGSLAGSYFFSKHLDIIAQVSKLYSKYQSYIPNIKFRCWIWNIRIMFAQNSTQAPGTIEQVDVPLDVYSVQWDCLSEYFISVTVTTC